MKHKEAAPTIQIKLFNSATDYDSFISDHNYGFSYGNRAKGVLRGDESILVIIDKSYYLSGGIKPKQLWGIVIHERVESTSKKLFPHLEGTIAEYQYIYNNYGTNGLKQYHANLCNLMGGINVYRNIALQIVIGRS